MQSLLDQIKEQLKKAMLDKDVFTRDTLRLVTSEVKRCEVDNRKDPSDEDVININKKMAKQRKDSIQQYRDGGRPDLEKIESDELELIQKFLPESLSGDALQEILKEIISKNSFTDMRDMGNIMKELKSKHPNAEMSEASSLVKSLLS